MSSNTNTVAKSKVTLSELMLPSHSNFSGKIHAINVNTDLLFQVDHSVYKKLENKYENFNYHEIISEHGHDAFLMEYQQLNQILKTIF